MVCKPAPESSPCPPSPTPPPDGGTCASPPPLTPEGNYPILPVGTCSACYRQIPFSWHIKLHHKIKGNGGDRTTIDATQRVGKPGLQHYCFAEDGSPQDCSGVFSGEMWRGCQEPKWVDYIEDERGDRDPNPGDGVVMMIYHDLWGYWGACDKISSSCNPKHEVCPVMTNPRENYRCQDSDDMGERPAGTTRYKVCLPDFTQCIEGSY